MLAPPTLWSSCLCFLNHQGVKRLHSKTPATQTVPEAMLSHQGGLKVSDIMSPVIAFVHEAESVKCSIPEMRKVSERICIVFIWILDITFFSFKSCTWYLTVQSNFRAGKMAQLVKYLLCKREDLSSTPKPMWKGGHWAREMTQC